MTNGRIIIVTNKDIDAGGSFKHAFYLRSCVEGGACQPNKLVSRDEYQCVVKLFSKRSVRHTTGINEQ